MQKEHLIKNITKKFDILIERVLDIKFQHYFFFLVPTGAM